MTQLVRLFLTVELALVSNYATADLIYPAQSHFAAAHHSLTSSSLGELSTHAAPSPAIPDLPPLPSLGHGNFSVGHDSSAPFAFNMSQHRGDFSHLLTGKGHGMGGKGFGWGCHPIFRCFAHRPPHFPWPPHGGGWCFPRPPCPPPCDPSHVPLPSSLALALSSLPGLAIGTFMMRRSQGKAQSAV